MSAIRNKRSFALSVVDSDSFLSLPRSARLLYYDLGMRADDRGFILSPRRLLRSIDAPEKDLKILLKAGYVYQFSSGVSSFWTGLCTILCAGTVSSRQPARQNWRNWGGNQEGGIMWCDLEPVCQQVQLR